MYYLALAHPLTWLSFGCGWIWQTKQCWFLGPRGPHGIPSLVSPSVRPQEKFGSHIYRLICPMNHLKTHQTSLMAPWDPLNAPLDPLGPPGPPHRPPMTPKQVSCPHWTLQITSPAFQIIRWPIKCHCWSYGTSYPSPSGLYSLVPPSTF